MENPYDQPGRRPGPRQVARLVIPVFIASVLVMVVGLVLVVTHHRTIGLVVIVAAAVGGFAVRAWLVIRSQGGSRRLP